uniref:Palmitoyltransferase n=1 Tax=Ursus maritimus TaxID=29073 RepID=A0A452VAL7_URSMA
MASLSPNPTCALELPEVPPHLLQHPARCPPPAAPSAGPCFQPESLSPVPASSLVEEGTGKGAHSVGHRGMSGLSWDLALGQVHRSRGVTGSHPEWAPSPCGPGPAACSLTPLPQVTGGLFSFHFLVHLIAVSIDPAEANVRLKKNYLEPMPTFDRSKHAHVIQKQYCHLCEVTVSSKAKHCSACNKCVSGFDHHCKWLNNCVGSRNYWYFFFSVASASAVLLCLIVTLLYIFIQFFIDPAELRTHPYYKKHVTAQYIQQENRGPCCSAQNIPGIPTLPRLQHLCKGQHRAPAWAWTVPSSQRKVSNKNTWLLFLPLFPVKTKTPVVLGIGVFVLLLDVISLLLLGHLLLFHLYLMAKKLSTFDYMTQGRQQQTPQASAEKEELSFQIRYPQQADNDQSSSEHREKHKELQPLRKCPSPCSTTAIHPENSLLPTQAEDGQSSSTQRVTSKELLLPDLHPCQSSATICPENAWLKDTDSRPTSSSALGRPRRKAFQSLPRSSSLISTTTAGPESALSLKGSKDQRETRQPVRGEEAGL